MIDHTKPFSTCFSPSFKWVRRLLTCHTLCLILALSIHPVPAQAGAAVRHGASSGLEEQGDRVELKNDFVHLAIDLGARSFSVYDSRTGEPLLENSTIKVGMEKGAELTVHREERVSDALGEGRRVILSLKDYGLYRYATHFRSGLPPQRLLSFTLYEDHPALVLGFGLLKCRQCFLDALQLFVDVRNLLGQ